MLHTEELLRRAVEVAPPDLPPTSPRPRRLLLAQAAVGAGTPQDAGPHLNAVTRLGELGPRRAAQLRIVQARVVMGSGALDRLTSTGHLAGQAIALAEQSGDPELSCAAFELAATAVPDQGPHGGGRDAVPRAGSGRAGAGLVIWRLRALNELGTVESLRDARPDRLEQALAAPGTAACRPMGATAAAAAAGIEAVTHGFAGRRDEMERLAHRGLELSPDDADLAAFVWPAGRGHTALIYEERDDAIAAFRRARQLAMPIRTLDAAIGPLLLVQAVQVVADVEAEQARSTAGARWSAAWLGYAHSVAQACAGRGAGRLLGSR